MVTGKNKEKCRPENLIDGKSASHVCVLEGGGVCCAHQTTTAMKEEKKLYSPGRDRLRGGDKKSHRPFQYLISENKSLLTRRKARVRRGVAAASDLSS